LITLLWLQAAAVVDITMAAVVVLVDIFPELIYR
jgi:hypothetical protein